MEKGLSFQTKFISKNLSEDVLTEIDELVLESQSVDLEVPEFTEELDDYYKRTTIGDAREICHYTTFDFSNINAILRDNWTYERNGRLTEERKTELLEYARKFSGLIDAFPPTPRSFIAYRGTTLSEFKKYGITTIDELMLMKGKFLYENGFTSTSLTEKDSFYNKQMMGSFKNIEIKYIVPENSQDGIPLTRDELSFLPSENEYVINKDALSKVLDVKIEGNNAIVTVVLIPKRIWNQPTKVERNEESLNR